MNETRACQRLDDALPNGVVELVDIDGNTKRLEGENLLVACAGHYSGMKPLRIGAPGYPSLLSQEPGYLVRMDDVEVALALDEFIHLALHALSPEQYGQLHDACGQLSFTGSEYYDPDTGKALQPKVRVAG